MSETLIDVKSLAAKLAVSVRTIYRMADVGQMPRPLKVGGYLNRWRESEIEAWIAAGCPVVRRRPAKP